MSKHDEPNFSITVDVRDHCLCLHLQRAARVVARFYDDALRPVQLTNGQFSLLMSLNRPEPPSLGDVSRLLGLDRTTLTANIKPLVRRGLTCVAVDPNDRRGRLLCLTAEGRALLATGLPLWKAAQADMRRRLRGVDIDRLRADLCRLA